MNYNHYFANKQIPDQYVSETEKQKEEWYICTINGIIDRALSVNEKSGIASCLSAASGKVSVASYQSIIKELQNGDTRLASKMGADDYINNIDFITPIKERYLGEYLRANIPFMAIDTNDSPEERMNAELYDKLVSYAQQLAINKLNEISQQDPNAPQTGLPSTDLPEVTRFVEEFKVKWKDAKTQDTQNILELLKELTGDAMLYNQAFYYWFATDTVFSYRTIRDGELVKEIVSPIEYYRVPGDSIYVCEDNMGMRKYRLSINEVEHVLGDRLSKQDKEYIYKLKDKYLSDKDAIEISIPDYIDGVRSRYDSTDAISWFTRRVGEVGTIRFSDEALFVDVYHVVIKSKAKFGTLIYQDQFGNMNTSEVTEDYELDKEAGDISISWEWRDIVLDGYRLGDDTGIYTKLQPVAFQYYDKHGKKPQLPYNGLTGLFKYYGLNPIPKRLIPHLVLHRLITKKIFSTIRKFKPDLLLMPEEALLDSKHYKMKERFKVASDDNMLIVAKDLSANTYQAIRNLGSSSAIFSYIEGLIALRDNIKQDAWELSNMNNERYGNVDSRGGKGVQEEAIRRVSIATVPMLEVFNHFRCKDYNLDIEYAKVAWVGGKSGVIISEEGMPTKVNIDGEELLNKELGIFVTSSVQAQEQLAEYKNLAFNASQNGNNLLASEGIASTNPARIRNFIRMNDELEKRMAREREEADRNVQLQVVEEGKALAAMQHQNRIEEINTTKNWDLVIKSMEKYEKANPDATNDEYSDELDRQLKQRGLEETIRANKANEALKRRDLDIKEKSISARNSAKK